MIMLLFYARCSTIDQNEARQIETAKTHNADKVFLDKRSGKDTNREQLKEMLNFAREGDTVMVESLSRLGRNTVDIINIVNQLNDKGVKFVSLKENIDSTSALGKSFIALFGSLAEIEREYLLDRQAQGIAIAKEKGVYKGRKPKEIDNDRFIKMCAEWRHGERTAVSIQKHFGITGTTFYRWVKEKNV